MTRRRALHLCRCTGCPAHPGSCVDLVPDGRCQACASYYEQQRGRRQARGYDAVHERLRAWWKPKVERGEVDCHAEPCIAPRRRLLPGEPWDLGHDRATGKHRGPEHRLCNRSEGGRAAHGG